LAILKKAGWYYNKYEESNTEILGASREEINKGDIGLETFNYYHKSDLEVKPWDVNVLPFWAL